MEEINILDEIAKGKEFIVIINPEQKHPFEVYKTTSKDRTYYKLEFVDAFTDSVDAISFAGRCIELEAEGRNE